MNQVGKKRLSLNLQFTIYNVQCAKYPTTLIEELLFFLPDETLYKEKSYTEINYLFKDAVIC